MTRKKSRKTLWNLFLNCFLLSMFAFGGGSTIIALLQKRFVEELRWIDETDMLDMLTQAQSAPGATVVNISVLIGYRIKGVPGALTSALATALPPLLVIMAVFAVYNRIIDSRPVSNAMRGMRACAAAMVASAVVTLLRSLIKNQSIFQAAVFIAAFAVMLIFHPSTIIVILGGLALGILYAIITVHRARQ